MTLDQKALTAAILAGSAECREYGISEPHDGIYEVAISAYRAALSVPAPGTGGGAPVAWRTRGRDITQLKEVADRWRRDGHVVEALGVIHNEDEDDIITATAALAEYQKDGGKSLAELEALLSPSTPAGEGKQP